mmetsp:Transcript_84607/g.171561  ORF Transcript_84607/g.171561 Transcript_84607/m.171561 type:complete len:250 (-) Transcript_84607:140-889(-)
MKTLLATLGLVPVQNSSGEWGYQVCTCLGSCCCLQVGKDQCDVALDAFLFQNLGSLDSFPSSGQLDENAATTNAHFVVHFDNFPGPLDTSFCIVAQANINLGRNTSGYQSSQFGSKIHRQFVHSEVDTRLSVGHWGVSTPRLFFRVRNGIGYHVFVSFVAVCSRLAHKERVGRGVGHETRLCVLFHNIQVTTVDRNCSHLRQFLESSSCRRRCHSKIRIRRRTTEGGPLSDAAGSHHECLAQVRFTISR